MQNLDGITSMHVRDMDVYLQWRNGMLDKELCTHNEYNLY